MGSTIEVEEVLIATVKFLKIIIIQLIGLPVFFMGIVPMLIYKMIVKFYCEHFKPDFGKMLSPCSSLMASEDLYSNPFSTLVPTFYFDGVLDYNHFMKQMEVIICERKYAELNQTLTSWMGFYFWKRCKNFSLQKHVTFIENPISEIDVNTIQSELARKPFSEGIPLWEMVVYTNFVPSDENGNDPPNSKRQTVFFSRFHHSLADGYALLHLLNDITESNFFGTVSKPTDLKRNNFEKIMFLLKLITIGPYRVLKALLDTAEPSPWKRNPEETTGEYVVFRADPIYLHDISRTAKSLGVSMTALLYSVYSGGVRNFMLEMGVKIPKKFITTYPFPVPGFSHPGSLTTHVTMVPVLAPLHQPNPLRRLMECNNLFKNLKDSPLPYGFYALLTILGSLINGIYKHLPIPSLASAQISNLPGPRQPPTLQGIPLTNFLFGGRIPFGISATAFTATTFSGKIYLTIAFDKCLYEDEEIGQKMMNFIMKELDLLNKLSKVVLNRTEIK